MRNFLSVLVLARRLDQNRKSSDGKNYIWDFPTLGGISSDFLFCLWDRKWRETRTGNLSFWGHYLGIPHFWRDFLSVSVSSMKWDQSRNSSNEDTKSGIRSVLDGRRKWREWLWHRKWGGTRTRILPMGTLDLGFHQFWRGFLSLAIFPMGQDMKGNLLNGTQMAKIKTDQSLSPS